MVFDYGTESWDKLDKEFLRKQVEKVIEESDGKATVQQLTKTDYDKWNGVNVQGYTIDPPDPEQKTLAIYIIDADDKTSKRFTATKSMIELLLRKRQAILYGTSSKDGRQVKIILKWEEERRV